MATVLVLLAAAVPAAQASPTVVGRWQLDEGRGTTVADSSGYGNNGTISGDVTWVAGEAGSALEFNGSPGDVQVPDSRSLQPASAVSVAAWIRHAGSPGTYRYILAKGAAGCVAASYGLYTGPIGGVEFYVSRHYGQVYADSPDAGTGIWDGGWHLVVGTFDGTTVRLYLDGAEVGSGIVYPGQLEYPLATSNDLFIGNYPGCQGRTFVGDIDDVSVWSGALSAAEVKAMVVPGAGTGGPGGSAGSGTGSASTGGQAGLGSSGTGSGGAGGAGASGDRKAGSDARGRAGAAVPALRLLRLVPARFRPAPVGKRTLSGGSAIRYFDTHAAWSTFRIFRREFGVEQAGRCSSARPRHQAQHVRRCRRYSLVGGFTHMDHFGFNNVPFSGRLRGRSLAPGIYLLSATPTFRGRRGATWHAVFQIIR